MKEKDFYPAGAYKDPNAPWNEEEENAEIEVDVEVAISLSHSNVPIYTTDYIKEIWEDWDRDGDEVIHSGGVDYNFDDTNFEKEYLENKISIIELLKDFASRLQKELDNIDESIDILLSSLNESKKLNIDKNRIKKLNNDIQRLKAKKAEKKKKIDACLDWTVDDIHVEKS